MSEYLIIKKRVNGLPGAIERTVEVHDDIGGSGFASALWAASVRLGEKYPMITHDVQQAASNPGSVNETYKASELAGVKW